jgi:hypothetical protein
VIGRVGSVVVRYSMVSFGTIRQVWRCLLVLGLVGSGRFWQARWVLVPHGRLRSVLLCYVMAGSFTRSFCEERRTNGFLNFKSFIL